MASLTPGTCKQWLWLLPSGPDQVHHLAMRGDPPRRIVPQAIVVPNVYGAKNIAATGFQGRDPENGTPLEGLLKGCMYGVAWR